jgi:hypothetical protein
MEASCNCSLQSILRFMDVSLLLDMASYSLYFSSIWATQDIHYTEESGSSTRIQGTHVNIIWLWHELHWPCLAQVARVGFLSESELSQLDIGSRFLGTYMDIPCCEGASYSFVLNASPDCSFAERSQCESGTARVRHS